MVIAGAPKIGDDDVVLPKVTRLPLPPADFDPLGASRDELARYGLPPPMGEAFPLYNAFRQRFLGPGAAGQPITFVAFQDPGISGQPLAWTTAAQGGMPVERSRNWSGGYLRPSGGRSFVSLMGSWTVPRVKPPPGASGTEFRSSTWIGLDGQGAYQNASLPQIGTAQEWKNGAADAPYAWYQWWARGMDTRPWPLSLPVQPGHRVSAMLLVVNPRTVRLHLRNDSTTSLLQGFDVEFNLAAPGQLLVSGATAEWIMERPAPLGTDGAELYDLPAYEPFSFTDCIAHSALAFGPPVEHDLKLAHLIRMYEIRHNPASTPTLSTVARFLPDRLDLRYVPPLHQPDPTWP